MSRTHRLFQLMQALRRLPKPVTAEILSDEMNVSIRTMYRDIDALRGLGAVIDGEAGFGYTLIEDAALPPLGFEDDELEALVLGLRDVAVIGDPALARAAESALAKIQSRVPPSQAHRLEHAILDAHRYYRPEPPTIDVGTLRQATWDELVVHLHYRDVNDKETRRDVQPLGLVYMDNSNVLLAKCRLRDDFRVFRLDRILALDVTKISFRPHRVPLLRQHLSRLRENMHRTAEPRAQ